MSMTNGEDLGKSERFQKVGMMLLPLAEKAARVGMSLRKLETGLLRTGKRVIDQCVSAQGKGDMGTTIAHPHHNGGSNNDKESSEPKSQNGCQGVAHLL